MQESIEKQLEQCKKEQKELVEIIADRGRLQNLYNNEDFKVLFLERFFKDEAIRSVALRGDSEAMQTPGMIERIDTVITAIGVMQDWFRSIDIMGKQAVSSLAQAKETEEELLREQAGAAELN